MKTVLFQPQQIKKFAPVATDLGTAAWPFKRVGARGAFHFGQHGQKTAGDGDGVGTARSTFGHGERDGAGLQIHAIKRDASFFQSASGVEGDFKANTHPFRNVGHGQSLSNSGNLLLGKDRLPLNGRFAGSEIHHSHGSHVTKQPALPVDPFQNLDVLQGLVAAHKGSVGSGRCAAPGNVVQGRGRGKILQNDAALGHKSAQVSPRVAVVDFGIGGDLMIVQQPRHPACVRCALVSLSDRKPSRLFNRFGSVQRVVRSVTGGLGFPHSFRSFESYVIPLAVSPLVNTGHGTSKSNHLKIGNN